MNLSDNLNFQNFFFDFAKLCSIIISVLFHLCVLQKIKGNLFFFFVFKRLLPLFCLFFSLLFKGSSSVLLFYFLWSIGFFFFEYIIVSFNLFLFFFCWYLSIWLGLSFQKLFALQILIFFILFLCKVFSYIFSIFKSNFEANKRNK